MKDMNIEQRMELEQLSPARDQIVLDSAARAQIAVEARRLQGATLARLIGRLFGRTNGIQPAHEDTMEQAFYRCHKRDAEVLRRLGETAARALSGRAVTGPMSDHLLKDVGLTRKDVEGRRIPDPRAYNPDVGSTAA